MAKTTPKLGRLFGRTDLERCDLFIDLGFLDWKEYGGKPVVLFESSKKGAQMYSSVPSGGHKKCGLPALSGYFDKHFRTIFVNDPYVDKWRVKSSGRLLNGVWIPNGPAKKHSTPGDNHGTFTKTKDMPAFSPISRKPTRKERQQLINFLTNPGKKGNAGYVDICINKYPPHSVKGIVDFYGAPRLLYSTKWAEHQKLIRNGPLKAGFYPQPYFDTNPFKELNPGPTYVQPKVAVQKNIGGVFQPPSPGKKMGNNHDGCFSKFTDWMNEPYKTLRDVEKELSKSKKSTAIFYPEARMKSYYTRSVVNNKIDISCNEKTWRTMKPITYPQFNL